MLIEIPYNRDAALQYAEKWALGRNPAYFDFQKFGGDCTNFASQCIYAGSGTMNFTPVYGWYYRSSHDRSASWSGVPYLYNFLAGNKGPGPYVVETDAAGIEPGDIVQLGTKSGRFYHTPFVVETFPEILVAAHTYDAYRRPLSSYSADQIRYLHIAGVRKYRK